MTLTHANQPSSSAHKEATGSIKAEHFIWVFGLYSIKIVLVSDYHGTRQRYAYIMPETSMAHAKESHGHG